MIAMTMNDLITQYRENPCDCTRQAIVRRYMAAQNSEELISYYESQFASELPPHLDEEINRAISDHYAPDDTHTTCTGCGVTIARGPVGDLIVICPRCGEILKDLTCE